MFVYLLSICSVILVIFIRKLFIYFSYLAKALFQNKINVGIL